MRLPDAFRHPVPVFAARGQLTVLPALEAGRRPCVAPRLAFNIVLAGEVGLQTDLHGTGHGPASASRVGHSLWEPTVAAARDAHPIRSGPSAQSVFRPPPAAGHGDRRRDWTLSTNSPPLRLYAHSAYLIMLKERTLGTGTRRLTSPVEFRSPAEIPALRPTPLSTLFQVRAN